MSNHATDWNVLQKALDHLTVPEKVELIELVARSLRAPVTIPKPADRRTNLESLRRELVALPVHNPTDGFSNRDHDDELYGGPR